MADNNYAMPAWEIPDYYRRSINVIRNAMDDVEKVISILSVARIEIQRHCNESGMYVSGAVNQLESASNALDVAVKDLIEEKGRDLNERYR